MTESLIGVHDSIEPESMRDELLGVKLASLHGLQQHRRGRGGFRGTFLNETTYTLVDQLENIARAYDSTVARVALAWVRTRPA